VALSLIRNKNAIQVFDEAGSFLGIKLGHYGPVSEWSPLPPAELPGLRFEDPNPVRRYARLKWSYA
jgi:hypothetical protein